MASNMDKETYDVSASNEVSSTSELSQKAVLDDPDQAYNFLTSNNASSDAASRVDLKRLRRKIDWYIVPIMFLCYTMQFIDKVSLNVSQYAQGISEFVLLTIC